MKYALAIILALAGIASAQSVSNATRSDAKTNTAPLANPAAGPTEYAQNIRDMFALEFDGLVTACPFPDWEASQDAACYRVNSSRDHHRWEINRYLDTFRDVLTPDPWEQAADGRVDVLFFIVQAGDYFRVDTLMAVYLVDVDYDTYAHIADLGPLE